MNQTPRKMLFIGGENQAHPIMEAGEHYVEIPDRRFSWPNWDLMLDPTRPRGGTSGQLSGRDMAGIAQCTAKAGRLVLDKASRPDGSRICIAWAADGRLRIIQELTVEELSPLQRASHRATLAQENTEAQSQAAESAQTNAVHSMEKLAEEVRLALRHAQKMEDAAREARERPAEAAGEIVRMIWDQLEPEEKTIALEIKKHDGNMNKATKSLGKNFSAIRRCRERLRDIYAEAGMELPKWLMNRDELTAWKKRQDANPGRTTPSGDLVRTNPNDADDLNNF